MPAIKGATFGNRDNLNLAPFMYLICITVTLIPVIAYGISLIYAAG